jgi:hypothetical protein
LQHLGSLRYLYYHPVANFSVDLTHGLAWNSGWNYRYNSTPTPSPSSSATLSSFIGGSDNANNCQDGLTGNKATLGLREVQADSGIQGKGHQLSCIGPPSAPDRT